MGINHMRNQVKHFWQDEAGLELSEYAVATALISLAVAASFTSLGSKINGAISLLESKITTT
jgi:Flp pilus assembly pilin Flp